MYRSFRCLSSMLFGLCVVSASLAFADLEYVRCNGAQQNGAVATCRSPHGRIVRIQNVVSDPIYNGSSTVIPCVQDPYFQNYAFDPNTATISAWGGCNGRFLAEVYLPYYFGPQQTVAANNHQFTEFNFGPTAIEVVKDADNGRCWYPDPAHGISGTYAWDFNRHVLALAGDCIATIRVKYRR